MKALDADNKTTIAAIIPVYNHHDTIVEAIESALAQTRPVDEIVVVDDGSTDGSADLVEQVFGERVRLLRQENRGPAAARNAAIRHSRAEILAFLDADDRWLPLRIERQAALMESHPSCMFCFAAHLNWSEQRDETRVVNAAVNQDTFLRKEFFRGQQFIATDTVMLRRQALDEVGLFDETLRVGQDTDLWLRVMVRYGFQHVAEPLAWVRRSAKRWDRAGRDLDRNFRINERFYAKHRYTFGRGLGGARVWRHARGFSLRHLALQFLDHGRRGRALAVLLRGMVMSPLAAPRLTVSLLTKIVFGNRFHQACRALYRRCRSAVRWEWSPRQANDR